MGFDYILSIIKCNTNHHLVDEQNTCPALPHINSGESPRA